MAHLPVRIVCLQRLPTMKMLTFVLLAGLPSLAPGSGASVEIGTNSIPLRILTETPRTFDTNRVAREFTLYCASSSRIEDFFSADPPVPGSSGQMDQNEPEGGPPETAAEDIRYGVRDHSWKEGRPSPPSVSDTNCLPTTEAISARSFSCSSTVDGESPCPNSDGNLLPQIVAGCPMKPAPDGRRTPRQESTP